MFEKVLVAVDGSEYSKRALAAARDLAQLSGGEVEVLHVRESHFIGRAGAVPDEATTEAQALIDSSVAEFEQAGVKASGSLRGSLAGRVALEIVDEAAEAGSSVIVMGSRGVTDLEGLLIGSTAHKVLHLCSIPVLVVR